MPAAPFLPLEVTELIIAQVSSNYYWDGETRSKALAVCCRISRMFLEPARLALYTHLEVQLSKRDKAPDGHVISYRQLDRDKAQEEAIVQTDSRALEQTLLTYPHLGPLARTLLIRSDVRDHEAAQPRMASYILAVILRCCPFIEELRFTQGWESGLAASVGVISLLQPRLQKLSVTSWHTINDATRNALSQSRLSALKQLDLRVLARQTFERPDDLPYPFRLESLLLEADAPAGDKISRMLSHLAPSCASSLKTLHVGLDIDAIDLSPFTQLESVTFLFYMSEKRRYENQPRIVAEALGLSLGRAGSQIRHLTLASLICIEYEYQSLMIAQVLPLLPTSLETLDLSSYALPAAPLLAFLHPSRSPALRRLVLYQIAPDDPDRLLPPKEVDVISAVLMKEVVEAGAARAVLVDVGAQDLWDSPGSRRQQGRG